MSPQTFLQPSTATERLPIPFSKGGFARIGPQIVERHVVGPGTVIQRHDGVQWRVVANLRMVGLTSDTLIVLDAPTCTQNGSLFPDDARWAAYVLNASDLGQFLRTGYYMLL